jgi:hypothetical protein
MLRTVGVALIGVLTAFGTPILAAQRSGERRVDAILDLLVWGALPTAADSGLAEPLRAEVRKYLERARSYRSLRPVGTTGEDEMVRGAQVRYERQLVSVTADPRAAKLAADYVDQLRPCYEWEGLSECPDRDAEFADSYLAEHPGSPFAAYLPLLAAHRWLCAAELFEFERNVPETAAARRKWKARLVAARKSTSLLVRTGAERLAQRASCFGAP